MHMRQQRDGVERGAEAAGIRRIDDDDELASDIAAMDLAAGKGEDRRRDLLEAFGAGLHQDAGGSPRQAVR